MGAPGIAPETVYPMIGKAVTITVCQRELQSIRLSGACALAVEEEPLAVPLPATPPPVVAAPSSPPKPDVTSDSESADAGGPDSPVVQKTTKRKASTPAIDDDSPVSQGPSKRRRCGKST